VPFRWQEPKEYSFEELKTIYAKALEMDDDNLTQFVDREELTTMISKAQSFESLVEVYRWMSTDHFLEGDEEID
jgi:hypothetical protein